MAVLKTYNLAGKETGQVTLDEALLKSSANSQMVKDYIVALRENARQWSACTKSRAEVNHSGKKPHPQKGTGRARQGYLGAAQYKGGGRVHAPKPKFDQRVRMNRKEKRAVIRHLLIEKITDNRLHVLKFEEMKEPKTSHMARFLKACQFEGKRVLFLGDALFGTESPTDKFVTFCKSIRNIPGQSFGLMPNVNGYDVMNTHELVVMDGAVDQLKVLLAGS